MRAPFERLFEARKKTIDELRKEGRQLELFKVPEEQLSFGDAKVSVPAEITIEDIERYLELFEKQALERHSIGDILFSIDAARSVGLLSILMKKYDVILMNPPYGDVTHKAKVYLKEQYPKTHNDVYATFIEQAVDLAEEGGYVGMLTNLSFMYLSSYQWLRENILKDTAPPRLILEFGWGILDGAQIQTVGTVLRKGKRNPDEETSFIRLTEPPTEEKEKLFTEALNHILEGRSHPEVFEASLEDLAQVPGMPYAYWAPPRLRELFINYPPLDTDRAVKKAQHKIADVKEGLSTKNDKRFVRKWWEVKSDLISNRRELSFQLEKCWVPFAKGDEYARYYSDILNVETPEKVSCVRALDGFLANITAKGLI